MGSCTVETVLKVLETKHDSYGRPEVNMWLQLLELAGMVGSGPQGPQSRAALMLSRPTGSRHPMQPTAARPQHRASSMASPLNDRVFPGSETESSLVQLVLSSVAKVLDRNSHWHSLQAARRQLQNQRFLQKKFHARWITVKL